MLAHWPIGAVVAGQGQRDEVNTIALDGGL